MCLSVERRDGLIQQDCVPGASHQARSQTERISPAARFKRIACTATRNVSLACIGGAVKETDEDGRGVESKEGSPRRGLRRIV